MDNDLKRDFGSFCDTVGMTMSTAFVIFAKTVVREQRFPFYITSKPQCVNRDSDERASMLALIEEMRRKAEASGHPAMSMEEIDAEIAASRRERVTR
jgi:DNA-damage-inducible protein J